MADMIELGPTYGKTRAATYLIIILEQCYRCVWTFENAVTRNNLSGREALRPTKVLPHTPWFLKRHVAKPCYFQWHFLGLLVFGPFGCYRCLSEGGETKNTYYIHVIVTNENMDKGVLVPLFCRGPPWSCACPLVWVSGDVMSPMPVWLHT